MAIIPNTVTTFAGEPGLAGLREDLTDVIYNLSPEECPFMTNIVRSRCTQVLHEWQTASLRAPAVNAQLQGDDAQFTPGKTTVRLGNRTQISSETAIVSRTARVVDAAGRSDEMAYNVAQKIKEVKRDIEFGLLQNQARVTGSGTVAPKLASVLAWIKTNVSMGATGANPVGDGSNARGDGTQRALTEALLKTVLQSIYTNSGEEPSVLMVPPGQKSLVSAFAGNAQKTIDVANKKMVTAIDVYSGDFSTVTCIPNRFMRARDALVLNYDLWALCWLSPLKTEELAKTGDADKRMVVCEYTLEARNEIGNGLIADLT